MGRGSHHSLASQARSESWHMTTGRLDGMGRSLIHPPIKAKSAMAHRWTDRTKALERPFKRNGRIQTKSKYAWRKQTYPSVQLIA